MKAEKFTILVHPSTGEERRVKNGFAWSVALFSFIALLVRRQFSAAVIFIGIFCAIVVVDIFILDALFEIYISYGIYRAIGIGLSVGFGNAANGLLVNQLLKQGYVIQKTNDDNVLEESCIENENE